MADDEAELTFEQMLARVAGPEGLASLLPKGKDGQVARIDLDELLESFEQPEDLALILRDIDENNDHELTRPELAKFYRELSVLLKDNDTRDARGNLIEGAPLRTQIDALLAQIAKIPDVSTFQTRLDAAQTAEERQALLSEYLEAVKPQVILQSALGAATAFLEERIDMWQAIARVPQIVESMVEDVDPENASSLRAAFAEIARYNFVRIGEYIEAPTIEEVFPNNPPAAAVNAAEPKTR